MAIRGQEIVSLIKRQIEEFGGDLTLVDVGSVVQVGDGVASIQGLQGVQSNELLDFGVKIHSKCANFPERFKIVSGSGVGPYFAGW